ncbi:MAG TPA: TetR family transcriptional regulator [Burkholderiaceae bacterium]|nr:TetR family transcriptional regulator [Burkholderiaceae bacterium]
MTAAATIRPRAKPAPASIRDAEATRRRILDAALAEFADKGLAGARIDVIAEVARSNKRMIYYYFESKEQLYIAVLEQAYIELRRAEAALQLDALEPDEAIRRLVHFKFDYYDAHPWLVGLLNGENMLGARFLRQSKRLRELQVSLIETLAALLKAGAKAGEFRRGVDPVELYLSIASLSYFYFSNRATLSTAFGQALDTPAALRRRREHATEVILGYLRP